MRIYASILHTHLLSRIQTRALHSQSQQRGPTCARYFAQKLRDLEKSDSISDERGNKYLTIYILRSGFEGWCRRFGDEGMRFIEDDD